MQITATTHNGELTNLIKYQLKDGLGLFEIDRDTGEISTTSNSIDYETTQEYTLVVEAQDRSTEPFRSVIYRS